MIAVQVCGDAIARYTELLREPDTIVAPGTGIAGEILLGDRRARIFMRLDGMDAVAVGADRRQAVAMSDGLPMDARVECLLNGSVTFAAGLGDFEF